MIDDLVRHLIKELASDSDLGTSASSFQSLVENFHLSVLSGTPTSFVQNVDDDYLSYIWSLLVSHPFVLVGKIKPNVASTQRKADELALGRKGELRMKKKEMDEQKLKLKIGEPTEILNQKDFRSLNWEQLKEELGESFRIVIEEEKVRQILTGTTDKTFVSPDQYQFLKAIYRYKAEGVTALSLGWSPFVAKAVSQSSVFSYIKALDFKKLVYKMPGQSSLIIARHYLKDSAAYLDSKAHGLTENKEYTSGSNNLDEEDAGEGGEGEVDGEGSSKPSLGFLRLPTKVKFLDLEDGMKEDSEDEDEDEDFDDGDEDESNTLQPKGKGKGKEKEKIKAGFGRGISKNTKTGAAMSAYLPGDDQENQVSKEDYVVLEDREDFAKHRPQVAENLSESEENFLWTMNRNLMKLRVLRLVELAKDGICVRLHLIARAGFPAMHKARGRKIMNLAGEYVRDGYLKTGCIQDSSGKLFKSVSLTELGKSLLESYQQAESESVMAIIAGIARSLSLTEPVLAMEATLDRQLLEHVASSDPEGAVLNGIKERFHGSLQIRRFLDYLASEKSNKVVLPHLSDTGIGNHMEQKGRLKFIRFHTYQTLQQLGLAEVIRPEGSLIDLQAIKGFPNHDSTEFYLDEGDLLKGLEEIREGRFAHDKAGGAAKSKGPIGRPKIPRDPVTGEKVAKHLRPPTKKEKAKAKKQEPEKEKKKGKGRSGEPSSSKKRKATPSIPYVDASVDESGAEVEADSLALSVASRPEPEVDDEIMGSEDEADEALGSSRHSFTLVIETPYKPKRRASGNSAEETAASDSAIRPLKRSRGKPQSASTPPTSSAAKATPLRSGSALAKSRTPQEDDGVEDMDQDEAEGLEDEDSVAVSTAKEDADRVSMPPPSVVKSAAANPNARPVKNKPRTGFNITRARRLLLLDHFFKAIDGVCEESSLFVRFKDFIQKNADVDQEGEGFGFMSDQKTRSSLLDEMISEGKLRKMVIDVEPNASGAQQTGIIWSIPGADAGLIKEACKKAQISKTWRAPQDATFAPGSLRGLKNRIKDAESLEGLLNDSSITEGLSQLLPIASQARGHITGPLGRLKSFHLEVMKLIDSAAPPVLSQEEGIVDVSYFWSECPLHVAVQFVCPKMPTSKVLAETLRDPHRRLWPVDLQPPAVLFALDRDRGESAVNELMNQLCHLKLATRSEVSTFQEDGEGDGAGVSNPHSWRFSMDQVPVMTFRRFSGFLYVGQVPVTDSQEARQFWKHMQTARGNKLTPEQEAELSTTHDFLRAKQAKGAWGVKKLYGIQVSYIQRCLREGSAAQLLEQPRTLQRIADGCVASKSTIKRFLDGKVDGRAPRDAESSPPPPLDGNPAELEELEEKAQRKALKAAKKRAAAAKEARDAAWNEAIEAAFTLRDVTADESSTIREAIKKVYSDFVKGATDLSGDELVEIFCDVIDDLTTDKHKSSAREDARKLALEEKEKRKKDPSKSKKRNKFEWTPELDDILHDSCVILRARDEERQATASNWAALRQVLADYFPNSNLASFKRRFDTLSKQAGEEAYLENLQSQWVKIWRKHRGTNQLPDPDPLSPTEFSLQTHLNFFRKHVRKDIAEAAMKKSVAESLPRWENEGAYWDFSVPPPELTWEYVFKQATNNSMASRYQYMADSAFCMELSTPSSAAIAPASPQERQVKNVIKMILQSEDARYSEEAANELIEQVGEDLVVSTTEKMLEDGTIQQKGGSSTHRRLPGRNFEVSDSTLATEDLFRKQILTRIESTKRDLETRLEEQTTLIVGPDIDDLQAAALLEMVRKGQVSCAFDPRDLEPNLDGYHINTRSMTDQTSELPIILRSNQREAVAAMSSSPSIVSPPAAPSVLGWIQKSGPDFDRLSEMVTEEWKELEKPKKKTKVKFEVELLTRLREALETAGEQGISLQQFELSNPGKATLISSLLERVTSGSRPLAFYEGSDSNGNPLLISFKFLKSWIIRLPNSAYALPRSWLDLEGEAVTLGWQDAVQTVLSLIFARPGILLSHVSARLHTQFRPEEVREAMEASRSMGVIEVQKGREGQVSLFPTSSWTIKDSQS